GRGTSHRDGRVVPGMARGRTPSRRWTRAGTKAGDAESAGRPGLPPPDLHPGRAPRVSTPVWLAGTLAVHRRGPFLRGLLAAEPSAGELPPAHGICLAFAADFQEAGEAEQQRRVAWPVRPGRALLLLPPLRPGACPRPAEWRVEVMSDTGAAPEGSLPAVL